MWWDEEDLKCSGKLTNLKRIEFFSLEKYNNYLYISRLVWSFNEIRNVRFYFPDSAAREEY